MCELGFKVLQLIFHRHISSTGYAVCLLPYNRAQSVCHLDKLRTGRMAHHPWWNSIADERVTDRQIIVGTVVTGMFPCWVVRRTPTNIHPPTSLRDRKSTRLN